MSKPSEAFEQAYDNFLAGCDVDTTMLDCAEFMFNAGRESVSKQAEPVAFLRVKAGKIVGSSVHDEMADGVYAVNTHPPQPVQPVELVGFLHEHAATQQKCLSFESLEDCDRPLGWTDSPLVHPTPAVAHPPAEVVREFREALQLVADSLPSQHAHEYCRKVAITTLAKAKEHGL